jgi:hypothetical protein
MVRPVSDSPLDRFRNRVEHMADSRTPFGEVEDAIHAAELADDEKAALWMLAWSLLGPRAQRQHAEASLALIGDR